MRVEPTIKVDIKDFQQSATKFMRSDYPSAVANFAKILSVKVEHVERKGLARDLDLKSGWIPKQINAFPKTKGQVSKIKNDVAKKHKFISMVAGKDTIGFMSGHNEGMTRKTKTNWSFGPAKIQGRLAIPGPGIKDRKYRGRSGRVRERYYPVNLMKEWKGKRAPNRFKNKKLPFLTHIKGNTPVIARRKRVRKSKPIEILWYFIKSASIKKNWDFDERGLKAAARNYQRAFKLAWKNLK